MSSRFDERYFSSVYKNYDHQNPSHKIRFYHSLAHKVLEDKVNPRILEIGCARGAFLKSADPGWSIIGCDTDFDLVNDTAGLMKNAKFMVCKLPDLPVRESFDLIAAFDVLEHVNDLDNSIVSIRNALKNDGSFVIVVPVYDGICGPLIHLLDKDPTHIHKRSRHFWLDLMEKHFEIVEWFGITRYYLSPFGYLHFVTKMLRQHTPAIAILGRKKL
jgi:SAM-dependent methyltransferase